ncbi:MAG: aldo/keto reductase [Thalassotalea sp.]
MQKIEIKQTDLQTSRLVYGCMRIAGDGSTAGRANGKQAISAAIDAGYNHFDHADIYAGGVSEELFGEVIKSSPSLRDNLIVTSKAGIRFADTPNQGDVGRYDFSKDYLLKSVDGSLKRLNTDYLDLFLLHRPDYLFDPHEVAEVFSQLKASGKVKHFGVSNFSPSQLSLLQSVVDVPLVVNQVEINLHNISSLENGTLDQCMEKSITPMAWCPIAGIAYSAWGNTFSPEQEQRLLAEANRQAEKYQCQPWIISFAWLLMHPGKICPIVGSTNVERILQAKQAFAIEYSREDWYRLLEARNGHPVA